MSKVGVIQIIDSLNTGGAEVLAVNIANGLSKKKINSHLCTTREEGVLKENIKNNVGFLFLNKKRAFDFFAILKFIKYIKKHDIGIMHAHSTSYFFAFCVKICLPNLSIVWHDHFGKTQYLNTRNVFPLNICSYFFKFIISVNSDLKNWSQDYLNCKKVYFLNNFAEFTNHKKITELKGVKGKRITKIAAFREQKDHLNLLKAFKTVLIKNPNYTLHLIGATNDSKYYNELKDYVDKEQLKKSVFFYGACMDIKNILNQTSIGVLSSKSEGLPVSLLEYGLAKLPVLVTDVGECKKVINNNKAIVDAENSYAFAEHLNRLINNENLRMEISKSLNENVTLNFNKEIFISKIKKFYQSI